MSILSLKIETGMATDLYKVIGLKVFCSQGCPQDSSEAHMYPSGWASICHASDGPLCVLITEPHVLGAFGWVAGNQYPGDRTKEQWFRVREGNRLGKMPGILPVLPTSNSYVMGFHTHL